MATAEVAAGQALALAGERLEFAVGGGRDHPLEAAEQRGFPFEGGGEVF